MTLSIGVASVCGMQTTSPGWFRMPLTLDAIYAETTSPLRLPALVTPREPDPSAALERSLRRKLARELTRVLDLFRAADVNVDNSISRREFQDVLLNDSSLSLSASGSGGGGMAAVDALFDRIDVDDSGAISFGELNRVLRKALDDEMASVAARRHRVARGDRIPTLSELKAMPGTVEYYEGLMKVHKASPRPLPKPLPPREAQRQKREANRQELRERRKRMEAISRDALTDEAFRRLRAKQRARAAALERRRAAIVMQSHGRAAIARQRQHAAREQRIRDKAAIALQSRSRGHRMRVHLEERKVEALEELRAKARARLRQNDAFLEAYFQAAEERLREEEEEDEEEEPPALPWWDDDEEDEADDEVDEEDEDEDEEDEDEDEDEEDEARRSSQHAAAAIQRRFLALRARADFLSARDAAQVVQRAWRCALESRQPKVVVASAPSSTPPAQPARDSTSPHPPPGQALPPPLRSPSALFRPVRHAVKKLNAKPASVAGVAQLAMIAAKPPPARASAPRMAVGAAASIRLPLVSPAGGAVVATKPAKPAKPPPSSPRHGQLQVELRHDPSAPRQTQK